MDQFVFSLSNGASGVLPGIPFRTANFPEKMIHCLFIRQHLSIKVAWVPFDQNPTQVKDYVFDFRHIFFISAVQRGLRFVDNAAQSNGPGLRPFSDGFVILEGFYGP